MNKLLYWIKRRPVRFAQLLVVVLAIFGFAVDPDQTIALVVALAAFLGGEAAQTQTTSKHFPRDDDGTPMVVGDAEHALSSAAEDGTLYMEEDPDPDDPESE